MHTRAEVDGGPKGDDEDPSEEGHRHQQLVTACTIRSSLMRKEKYLV